MSHRFFLSQTPTEDTARLEGDEARHLARVMRAKPVILSNYLTDKAHHGLLLFKLSNATMSRYVLVRSNRKLSLTSQ